MDKWLFLTRLGLISSFGDSQSIVVMWQWIQHLEKLYCITWDKVSHPQNLAGTSFNELKQILSFTISEKTKDKLRCASWKTKYLHLQCSLRCSLRWFQDISQIFSSKVECRDTWFGIFFLSISARTKISSIILTNNVVMQPRRFRADSFLKLGINNVGIKRTRLTAIANWNGPSLKTSAQQFTC